jgi:hypothetical protein
MVFQSARLLPWRTVEENVQLAAPDATPDALAALFDIAGLTTHRRHYPGELSFGLARRVALARAFAVEPDLLLLDEPFGSLDSTLAAQLGQALVELVARNPVTTLLVTHDIDVGLADRLGPDRRSAASKSCRVYRAISVDGTPMVSTPATATSHRRCPFREGDVARTGDRRALCPSTGRPRTIVVTNDKVSPRCGNPQRLESTATRQIETVGPIVGRNDRQRSKSFISRPTDTATESLWGGFQAQISAALRNNLSRADSSSNCQDLRWQRSLWGQLGRRCSLGMILRADAATMRTRLIRFDAI